MISIGERDWVIHNKTGNRGQVLEIADDIAYIELENGVEMDFPISELMLEDDYKSPEEERQEEISKTDAVTLAVAELILAEVRPLIEAFTMVRAFEAAKAVVALGGTATPWEEMNAFHKMNFISVSTGTTYMDWVHAYNENKMAKFQLVVLMNLGNRVGIK